MRARPLPHGSVSRPTAFPCLRVLAAFAALCAGAMPASAATTTYSWTNVANQTSWNSTTSWAGGVIPTSGLDTAISINTSQNAVTTNNIGAFTLNRLSMQTGAGSTKTLSVGGSSLIFVKDTAGLDPAILLQNRSTSGMTLSAPLTVTDALTITHAGTTGVAISGAIANTGGITFSGAGTGPITLGGGVTSGVGGISYTGSYVINVSGANTYTGVTTFGGGTVSTSSITNGGNASNLGRASADAANLVFDGGALRYSGATATSDRAFTINAGKTATIEVTNAAATLTLAGATGASTDGGLTKSGAGTLALSGASTHTGATQISAGTLLISAGASLDGSSIVVSGGAAISLADGSSCTFTIGVDGYVNGVADGKGISGSGANTVSLDGDFVFDLSSAGATQGDSWTIIDIASVGESYLAGFSIANAGAIQIGNVWSFTDSGTQYAFDQSTGVLQVVPEPAAAALFAFGITAFLYRRRKTT